MGGVYWKAVEVVIATSSLSAVQPKYSPYNRSRSKSRSSSGRTGGDEGWDGAPAYSTDDGWSSAFFFLPLLSSLVLNRVAAGPAFASKRGFDGGSKGKTGRTTAGGGIGGVEGGQHDTDGSGVFDDGSREEFDDEDGGESSIAQRREETADDNSGGRDGADVSSVAGEVRGWEVASDWTQESLREKLRPSLLEATAKVVEGAGVRA